eukprot:TRINITY_DN5030_c0_g1_i1.p1 TRINITY_DN5030_c0_g1~~TRINITY_DN5030_c0_g1_i1.p1  ORF type:complete len:911 (+),score=229.19 TRINITY_DN5030_c0_g1_i1:87-2819(+)
MTAIGTLNPFSEASVNHSNPYGHVDSMASGGHGAEQASVMRREARRAERQRLEHEMSVMDKRLERELEVLKTATEERTELFRARDELWVETARTEQAEIDRLFQEGAEKDEEAWRHTFEARTTDESREALRRAARQMEGAEMDGRASMENSARLAHHEILKTEQLAWHELTRIAEVTKRVEEEFLTGDAEARRQQINTLQAMSPRGQLEETLSWARRRRLWGGHAPNLEAMQSFAPASPTPPGPALSEVPTPGGDLASHDTTMQRELERVLAEGRYRELAQRALQYNAALAEDRELVNARTWSASDLKPTAAFLEGQRSNLPAVAVDADGPTPLVEFRTWRAERGRGASHTAPLIAGPTEAWRRTQEVGEGVRRALGAATSPAATRLGVSPSMTGAHQLSPVRTSPSRVPSHMGSRVPSVMIGDTSRTMSFHQHIKSFAQSAVSGGAAPMTTPHVAPASTPEGPSDLHVPQEVGTPLISPEVSRLINQFRATAPSVHPNTGEREAPSVQHAQLVATMVSQIQTLSDERDREKQSVEALALQLQASQQEMETTLGQVRREHQRQLATQEAELRRKAEFMDHLKHDRMRAQDEAAHLQKEMESLVAETGHLKEELLAKSSVGSSVIGRTVPISAPASAFTTPVKPAAAVPCTASAAPATAAASPAAPLPTLPAARPAGSAVLHDLLRPTITAARLRERVDELTSARDPRGLASPDQGGRAAQLASGLQNTRDQLQARLCPDVAGAASRGSHPFSTPPREDAAPLSFPRGGYHVYYDQSEASEPEESETGSIKPVGTPGAAHGADYAAGHFAFGSSTPRFSSPALTEREKVLLGPTGRKMRRAESPAARRSASRGLSSRASSQPRTRGGSRPAAPRALATPRKMDSLAAELAAARKRTDQVLRMTDPAKGVTS